MIAGRVHTWRVKMSDSHELPDEDEDDGPSYAEKVNAPLPLETIEALRKALESGERATFRRPRKAADHD